MANSPSLTTTEEIKQLEKRVADLRHEIASMKKKKLLRKKGKDKSESVAPIEIASEKDEEFRIQRNSLLSAFQKEDPNVDYHLRQKSSPNFTFASDSDDDVESEREMESDSSSSSSSCETSEASTEGDRREEEEVRDRTPPPAKVEKCDSYSFMEVVQIPVSRKKRKKKKKRDLRNIRSQPDPPKPAESAMAHPVMSKSYSSLGALPIPKYRSFGGSVPPSSRQNSNWTYRFQEVSRKLLLLERKKNTLRPDVYLNEIFDLNLEVMGLSQDFVHAAKTYGKIIISEAYMEKKTILPVDVGGRAGGDKYIINNILFKFALDSFGLFNGNDHYAAKVAGHELKWAISFLNLGMMSVTLPLVALVDYRGFRLIAVSLLPISSSSLIYGTKDGGETMYKENTEMNKYMRMAGRLLNLKPHVCGMKEGATKNLWTAADLEGHLGTDGKFYLLDFSRTLPPTQPDRRVYNGHLFQLFRSEFISAYSAPLCPDAYSSFILRDPKMKEHNEEIVTATKHLYENVIPAFAKDWLFMTLEAEKQNIVSQLQPHREMHRKGINMRYLGKVVNVLSKFEMSQSAITLLMAEGSSRVIKNLLQRRLQEKMRELKLPLEVPYRQVVIDHMNLVFSEQRESFKYWGRKIRHDMELYFNFTFFVHGEEQGLISKRRMSFKSEDIALASDVFNLQHKVLLCTFSDGVMGREYVFDRLRNLTGLKFTRRANLKFYGKTQWNPKEPLDLIDLMEIGERVKHLNIVAKAEVRFIYLRAIEAKHMKLFDFSEFLFSSTIEKLENSLSMNANDMDLLFMNIAARFHLLDACYKNEMPFPPIKSDVMQLDRYFRRFIEIDSKNAVALAAYGHFLERCERFREAETMYLRSFETGRECLYALFQYGYLLLRRGLVRHGHTLLARLSILLDDEKNVIDPFTDHSMYTTIRIYLEDGTYKAIDISVNTSVATIKERFRKYLLSKAGKNLLPVQVEALKKRYSTFDLLMHGDAIVTESLPTPYTEEQIPILTSTFRTRLLADHEKPWIILHRPRFGSSCKLLFRTYVRSQDEPPQQYPFNVRESFVLANLNSSVNLMPSEAESSLPVIKLSFPILKKILGKLSDSPPKPYPPIFSEPMLEQLDKSLSLFFKTANLDGFLKLEDTKASDDHSWMLLLTFLNYQLTLLIYNVVSNFCLPSICSTSETIKFTLNQHTMETDNIKGVTENISLYFENQKLLKFFVISPTKASPQKSKMSKSKDPQIIFLKEMLVILSQIHHHVYQYHWVHIKSFEATPIITVALLIVNQIYHAIGSYHVFDKKEIEKLIISEIASQYDTVQSRAVLLESIDVRSFSDSAPIFEKRRSTIEDVTSVHRPRSLSTYAKSKFLSMSFSKNIKTAPGQPAAPQTDRPDQAESSEKKEGEIVDTEGESTGGRRRSITMGISEKIRGIATEKYKDKKKDEGPLTNQSEDKSLASFASFDGDVNKVPYGRESRSLTQSIAGLKIDRSPKVKRERLRSIPSSDERGNVLSRSGSVSSNSESDFKLEKKQSMIGEETQEGKRKEVVQEAGRPSAGKADMGREESQSQSGESQGRQRSQTEAKIPSFKRNEATVAL